MTNPTQDHLTTTPANTTIVAWHSSEDIQAIRLEFGTELLIVNGNIIPLQPWMHTPVQQVINYCSAGKRAQKLCHSLWEGLRSDPPPALTGAATKAEG